MERDNQTQIAVLSTKLESMADVIDRMDHAIQRIADMNESMSKLLAVHSEKLEKQDKVDDILFNKIDNLTDRCNTEFQIVKEGCRRDILMVKDRLQSIERRMYMAMGGILVLSFFIRPIISTVTEHLFFPDRGAIIESVVKVANEPGNGRIHHPDFS